MTEEQIGVISSAASRLRAIYMMLKVNAQPDLFVLTGVISDLEEMAERAAEESDFDDREPIAPGDYRYYDLRGREGVDEP